MKARLKNESGQAMIEYVLLLAIVFGSVISLRLMMQKGVDRGIAKMGGTLEVQLRTGSMSASHWEK